MSHYFPGHTYTKKLFIGYLKFQCNWVSSVSSGNPTWAPPLEILILLVWGQARPGLVIVHELTSYF